LGISLLPELAVAEEIRRGELVKLAWKEPILLKAIMVFHRDKWLSPPLAAFKQLVLSNINI
jgi:DNA-binding transcriptional LysR family regulator